MFRIFKISGDSLYPFYKDGQRILCRKVFKNTVLHTNDIIVFEKKTYGLMIKQIKKITKNTYFVQGTSPDSIDSRDFGALDFKEIHYKVLIRI